MLILPACLAVPAASGGKGILAEEEQLLYNLRLEKEGEARREIAAEREKLEQEARNSQVSVSRGLTWHRYQVHGCHGQPLQLQVPVLYFFSGLPGPQQQLWIRFTRVPHPPACTACTACTAGPQSAAQADIACATCCRLASCVPRHSA
jgi:hypothetical protein